MHFIYNACAHFKKGFPFFFIHNTQTFEIFLLSKKKNTTWSSEQHITSALSTSSHFSLRTEPRFFFKKMNTQLHSRRSF